MRLHYMAFGVSMKQKYRNHILTVWQQNGIWQSTITGPDGETSSHTWIATSAEEVLERLRAVVNELLQEPA